MKGWVYVITNRAMPDLIKVGFSTKDPDLRADELSHTGSPHPYRVEYEVLVEEPYTIEQRTHKLLSLKREGKEWFKCSIEEAIAAIKQIVGNGVILETFKGADRAKAEELYAQKTKLEHEKREREASERILEQQISNEESEITRTYQHQLKLQLDKKPFWVYWLGGTVLCIIAVLILFPKAGGEILWVCAICGAGVGTFLQSYFEDKKKKSAQYIAIEKQRDTDLAGVRLKVLPCKGCNTNYKLERKVDFLNRIKKSPGHALICPKCNSKVPYPWPIQS